MSTPDLDPTPDEQWEVTTPRDVYVTNADLDALEAEEAMLR